MSRGQAIVQAVRNAIEPSRPYGVIIPDFYFDWLFPLLLPSEISVLLYACRSILGYSQHRAERTDLISLSQISDGVRAGDRVYRRGTGLALSTIQSALAALERANILYPVDVVGGELVRVRQKPRGRGRVTRYTLVERAEDIDWEWLEDRREPAAEREPGEAKTAALDDKSGDKSTDLPGVKPPVGRGFSEAETTDNRGFSEAKTTDLPREKLPIIGSTDNNTDKQLTECFAFGGNSLPRRDRASEGLRAYRKATGFNPTPAARQALQELEAEVGTEVFLEKLQEYVLAGKNVRNVSYFADFARGKAVLARPKAGPGAEGRRDPAVRRNSRYTEEELAAARAEEARRGGWADVPEVDDPGGSGDVLAGGQAYRDWLREAGGLGGLMAGGP